MGLFVCFLIWISQSAASQAPAKENLFDSGIEASPKTEIDKLVFARLDKLGIKPANLCSDSVFLRRAYLDVIGTLPAEEEVKEFLGSREANKRADLIEKLLEREEFADYWAMKWCDLLRVKAEFPVNLWPNAVQTYHRWIRTSIAQKKPYNQFVREMLTSSGSNFRDPPVNFYRAMQNRTPAGIARTVALTFMGARAEKWPANQLNGMAAFFSGIAYKSTGEWKEEIVYFDPDKFATNRPSEAILPDGKVVQLPPEKDPRTQFADWLINPENHWFTRNIVNRVWSWLLGRGIIHEADDIRPDNPPVNPELLAYLEEEFIRSGYDLQSLFRLILNSQTYQLSCVPRTNTPEAAANFAHYSLRRLEAEVLIDALNQATWTVEAYSSEIPEPFTFVPEDHRAISLADGSITTSFLEMFGRPPRDTGLESERSNEPSAAQRLHLLNSSHINRKMAESPALQMLALSQKRPREIMTHFYLTILSRYPTEEELKTIQAYSESGEVGRRDTVMDLLWSLINSVEFLFRH